MPERAMPNTKAGWDCFRDGLRTLLHAHIGTLLDVRITLMEQEIAEGWRSFYFREIWLGELVPPPLINALGRAYSCEWMLLKLYRDFGAAHSGYASTVIGPVLESAQARQGYRNYLEPGSFDIGLSMPGEEVLDETANRVTSDALALQHRHYAFERQARMREWALVEGQWATRTPPYLLVGTDRTLPQRDMSCALEDDAQYWRAYYGSDVSDVGIVSMPSSDVQRRWMADIAPDFPYSGRLSKAGRLVFTAGGQEAPCWAIVMCRDPGARLWSVPVLVLLAPSTKGKWTDAMVLFQDILAQHCFPGDLSGRGHETFLLYLLPRFRRLIRHYQPYVDAVLADGGHAVR